MYKVALLALLWAFSSLSQGALASPLEGGRVMLMAKRNMMVDIKLPYDAEVEYLEGYDYTYIDTGIAIDHTYGISFTFKPLNNYASYPASGWRLVFGMRSDPAYAAYKQYQINYNLANRRVAFDSFWADTPSVNSADANFSIFNEVSCDFRNGRAVGRLNGKVFVDYAIDVSKVVPTNAWLFRSNIPRRPSDSMRYQHLQVASAKIWKIDGDIVRDFIPVRKDGVGYMYDRVSGQLFGNQGTGAFIIGPDKS